MIAMYRMNSSDMIFNMASFGSGRHSVIDMELSGAFLSGNSVRHNSMVSSS